MEIITPEPTPQSPLTEEETKQLRYIRSRYMDKYDGGPPFKGDEAYLANIRYLEAELVRVRMVLQEMAKLSDSGDRRLAYVGKMATESLKIPV